MFFPITLIRQFLIIIILFLINFAAFAQTTQPLALKIDDNVTSTQEKLIAEAFLYLNKFWADQGKSLSRNITEKYFTPDTTLIINGKTVYTGYDQFETHFKAVGKNIIGQIQFPLLEMMSVNNKVVVHFNEAIHDNKGNAYPANVIAIFTLQNGKIQRWDEVANTNYFCQAESAKVVYSK